MDRTLQGKAIVEILDSYDVYIASRKKGDSEKVGAKLGGTLKDMGVTAEEAKVLFRMLEQRLFDESAETDDSDVCFLYCPNEQDGDNCPE